MSFLYTPSEYLRPWKLFSLAAGIALPVALAILVVLFLLATRLFGKKIA